jgi:hypothetical protein
VLNTPLVDSAPYRATANNLFCCSIKNPRKRVFYCLFKTHRHSRAMGHIISVLQQSLYQYPQENEPSAPQRRSIL